jgi:hypothetical protein
MNVWYCLYRTLDYAAFITAQLWIQWFLYWKWSAFAVAFERGCVTFRGVGEVAFAIAIMWFFLYWSMTWNRKADKLRSAGSPSDLGAEV